MCKLVVVFFLKTIQISTIQEYKGIRHNAHVLAKERGTDDTKYAIGC